MTREKIIEELNGVFREVFDDDKLVVTDTTKADDIEDWNSLEQINLMVAIEERFGIKFTMSEVTAIKKVGVIVDAILEKI